jgi:hypothetical protein
MKSMILALMALFTIQAANAQSFGSSEVREISLRHKTGWYSTGSTLVHHFPKPAYVERMLISAEGYRNFAKAFVYEDGDMISLLGVPGRDPDYPVVVRKTVSAIVLKFEGDVRILDFRIYAGGSNEDGFNPINPHQLDTPAELGRAVIQVIASLQSTVSPANFNQFLLPLRKSALVLSAKGQARPLLSDNTQRQARVIIAQIEAAESFLLNTLGTSAYYTDHVQTLLFVKEKLQSMKEPWIS